MKKCLFLIVLICSLLLCAAAFADREISITTLDGTSGTIKVPDDVTVILEKGGSDGISVTAGGSRKTFTLSSYEVSAGTGGFPAAGDAVQKVVVMELSPQTINTGKGTPVTCVLPMTHLGTVQSYGNGTLVLDSFEYSGDAAAGYAMTEAEWHEYETYVSDIDMKCTAKGIAAENSNGHNIVIHTKNPNYVLDIYGNSEITVDVSIDKHLLYYHYTGAIKYGLIIDNLAIKELETPELSLMIPIPLCELGLTAGGKGDIGTAFSQYFEIDVSFNIGACDPNFKITADQSSGDADVSGDGEVDLFVGAQIGPKVEVLEFVTAGINYKLGLTVKYRGYKGHYFVEDNDKYMYHACNDCIYKGLFPQIGPLAAEIELCDLFSRSYALIPEKKMKPLKDYYWSRSFPQEGEGTCPLIAYKLDVHVQDEHGAAIKGAEVTYKPNDEIHFKDVSIAQTDPFGNASIYIPLKNFKDPNPVTVTAAVQDPKDPTCYIEASANITEKGIPKKESGAANEEDTPPDPEKLTLTLVLSSREDDPVEYRITEGNGSRWYGQKTGSLRFAADGKADDFKALEVDGKTVPGSRYTLTSGSGSTIVDLPAKYLNTLSRGEHRIRFVYKDGSASGRFSVILIPKTGDASRPLLWGLLVLCGLGLGAGLLIRRKRNS